MPSVAGTPGVQLRLAEARLVILSNGTPVADLNDSSLLFFQTLDAQNYGTYSWVYPNNTASAISNVTAVAFLDADIDLSANGFANEFGSLVNLSVPPGAPARAIAPSIWEIDEPGYVFGNIFQHIYTGALDNSSAVAQGTPDDVSMALGFNVGQLAAGDQLNVTITVSKAAATGGLKQTDPNSNLDVYYNGYALTQQGTPGVPAPSSLLLVGPLLGLAMAFSWFRKRSTKSTDGGAA